VRELVRRRTIVRRTAHRAIGLPLASGARGSGRLSTASAPTAPH